MTQVSVDIDQAELTQVKDILDTTKNTEAVQLAIREVIAARARRDVIAMFSAGIFSDLADPEIHGAAWS